MLKLDDFVPLTAENCASLAADTRLVAGLEQVLASPAGSATRVSGWRWWMSLIQRVDSGGDSVGDRGQGPDALGRGLSPDGAHRQQLQGRAVCHPCGRGHLLGLQR